MEHTVQFLFQLESLGEGAVVCIGEINSGLTGDYSVIIYITNGKYFKCLIAKQKKKKCVGGCVSEFIHMIINLI